MFVKKHWEQIIRERGKHDFMEAAASSGLEVRELLNWLIAAFELQVLQLEGLDQLLNRIF